MKVRRAVPADLPRLEELRRKMSYPKSLFLDEASFYQQGLLLLREFLSQPDEFPDMRLMVLDDNGVLRGFLQYVVDQEHGVTQQRQTRLLNYAILNFDDLQTLITRTARIVTAFENEYLIVDLPACDKRLQMWFYRCGFRAEQQRVAKRIPQGFVGIASPNFRFRAAKTEDLPFILEVHSAYCKAYLPAGRDTDLEALKVRYQLIYLHLDFSGSDGSVYYIMEETSSQASVGYLFIRKGPLYGTTPSYYIYDVAIVPDYVGRGLSLFMAGVAETLAGRNGAIIYGDGSLGTPLLASWHEQMGYIVDTVQFSLDCRA